MRTAYTLFHTHTIIVVIANGDIPYMTGILMEEFDGD